jgi:hypothetical protein
MDLCEKKIKTLKKKTILLVSFKEDKMKKNFMYFYNILLIPFKFIYNNNNNATPQYLCGHDHNQHTRH